MTQIFVGAHTQKIIVDPALSAARVVLAGPVGPQGLSASTQILTQAEYNDLQPKDPSTIYFVTT